MSHFAKKFILFDLDGTLTDPKVGITKSIQYSLRSFQIEVDDLDDLLPFIGPPLRESYRKFYDFSADDAEAAVKKYREYFLEYGIYENVMYEGIGTLLEALKADGKTVILATSKPIVLAEKVLQYFDLRKYFHFVSGAELDGSRSDKAEVIEYALGHCGVVSRGEAVMIGDREYDIIGARKAGIDSIGVLYGYGGYSELHGAGADFIVSSIDELSKLFI